jgi:hypothetical protein
MRVIMHDRRDGAFLLFIAAKFAIFLIAIRAINFE